jgi:hypothetical protein
LTRINRWSAESSINISMRMNSHDLARHCNDAMRSGVDFPTLWNTIIKPHPAVIGMPVQRMDGNRTWLEIPLLRGDWLVVDTAGRMVSVR